MSLTSLWTATTLLPHHPALEQDLETSVAVIGGGIAGLTAALDLQLAGIQAVVLEARRLGAGETGHTSAHLTELIDSRYHVLESKFGRDGARLAAEASRAAIDAIEDFTHEFKAPCGFQRVPGFLYAETEAQEAELRRETESLMRAGAEVAWLDAPPTPFRVRAAIRIERQAQLDPMEYLGQLAAQFIAAGGRIFEQSEVVSVQDGSPCRVHLSSKHIVTAENVFVLAHVPVTNLLKLHTKISAHRSYAIATRMTRALPSGLFWDMEKPYHYMRTHQTERNSLLIVGGEDHKTGHAPDPHGEPFARLAKFAATHFGAGDVVYRWSGQIIEPADGLPFIGKNPGEEHVYVATGFSGTGLTLGTVAGVMLADAARGIGSPWAELFSPARLKPIAQAKEFVTENVDFPAAVVRDRFDRGEVPLAADVAPGEGRLVRANGKMLAVYRSLNGTLTACSAVCTHLGCYVHWNGAERTWDCPCHGSRFGPRGSVLNGPATRALDRATIDESLPEPKRVDPLLEPEPQPRPA